MEKFDETDLIAEARSVLKIEAEGIINLVDRLDHRFATLVNLVYSSTGRVIVSGIGKSGLVGRKIAATLNSTGTRSFFLHPVEAMHGDLGMVDGRDIFFAMSNSGETEEMNFLLHTIREMGCKIAAFTGDPDSTMAQLADVVIDVGVKREACPLGLAPTASSTALLAMGDALAVVLSNRRRFKSDDFKKIHPGGALGHRLSGRISDMMMTGDNVPVVYEDTDMKSAVAEMDRLTLGVTLVLDKTTGTLSGIITDGDLRRFILQDENLFSHSAKEVMTPGPLFRTPDTPAWDALNLMEKHQITVLPICDAKMRVRGVLHLHDILGKGEFKFNGA